MAKSTVAPVEEKLTVAAVARRIGVAPATLRTWDRRYGLGPSEHVEGQHRRYCPQDLARLTMMRRLIIAGVSPSDAAEQAKSFKGVVKISKLVKEFEVREDVVDALYKGLQSLDRTFVETSLAHEIDTYGIEGAWTDVIVPTLFLIGDEWENNQKGIEVEHLFSEILKNAFYSRTVALAKPLNPRPVLLAAVGEEVHSLPIYALAAALCERNIESYVLGARTPIEAISTMVTRCAPPAIFLWAQLPQNADTKYWQEIPSIRPAPRILVGGPGWDAVECASVIRAEGLEHACDEITQAIGA
ncbi:MAG: MerR family transcriptional regulator [Actinomycetota bacterium]|jgi:DNA-binding transcriptional MerR regulator